MDILKQIKYNLIILQLIIPRFTWVMCSTTGTSESLLSRVLFRRNEEPTTRFRGRTTQARVKRTLPFRESLDEQCDYKAKQCLKAYNTGRVCGRTLFYRYETFQSFCMLDYVNCRERYEVWQVLRMGHCYTMRNITDYVHSEYTGDDFLDKNYVIPVSDLF